MFPPKSDFLEKIERIFREAVLFDDGVNFLLVQVRGAREGYAAARTTMETVHALLAFAAGITSNANTYDAVEAAGDPYYLGTDANDRPLFGCNYDLWLRGIGA